MEPISKELEKVLAKVGPVGGSHVVIAGTPFGVHKDITPKDQQVIIDEIAKIPMITDRSMRVTSYELNKIFGDATKTFKFMFACCLLTNKYKTPIFTIHAEGNYDRLTYQGEIKNVVIDETYADADKKEEPKQEKTETPKAVNEAKKEEATTTRKPRASKTETKEKAGGKKKK